MVLYFFILLLLRYRNVEQNVFLHYFQNKSLDCIWAFMRPQNRVVVEYFLYLCPLLELSICTKYAEKNLKLKKKLSTSWLWYLFTPWDENIFVL